MVIKEECEYMYCKKCKEVRYRHELDLSKCPVQCHVCGGSEFEDSGWVQCPFHKCAVKCAVAGIGLLRKEYGYECLYHCNFFVR